MRSIEEMTNSVLYAADALANDMQELLNCERDYRGVQATYGAWDVIMEAKKRLAVARMDADASVSAYRVARRTLREANETQAVDTEPVTKY